jgi:hypothetical protein
MCDCKSKEFALLQQAKFDNKNNIILYGTSNQIGTVGVSNGEVNKKCNVFDEMVYKKPCSAFVGTAGGNPCVEKFEKINGLEKNDIILFIILLIFLLLLKNI